MTEPNTQEKCDNDLLTYKICDYYFRNTNIYFADLFSFVHYIFKSYLIKEISQIYSAFHHLNFALKVSSTISIACQVFR